ncbi:STAS domain-containing protein [Streptomyces flavotricini]|uniref:STAS domain-containing protein n=1 Tax=Streptomyces flavotricini TaxID=66888 RepID=A0ABS8E140_9ACTN|nr:STAS domain-containing protein [Streptomyces flavotricini]MCC0094359.1 STAS domain-containing protein [Streptomyces flavotricini]
MSPVHRSDGPVPPVGAQALYDDVVWADAVVRCSGEDADLDLLSDADATSGGTRARRPLTARPLPDRPGALLRGSCDLDTRPILSAALGVVTRIPGPVVHLDLSGVPFLDAAAVAALVQANATVAGQGRRLVLHHPPYSLRKVVEMFPDECAALEVAA